MTLTDNVIKKVPFISSILVGIVVSCYYFPFELTFLPKGLNTKIMLAGVGILLLGWYCVQNRRIQLDRELIPAIIIAILFSIIGYISVDINHSEDYAYATYFISFSTWMLAAYATYSITKYIHGYIDFLLLMNYLIAICVFQCFMALAIDNILVLKLWVDTHISQDTVASVEFLNKVNRLYGIGAAVDVAGTRFSIVLLGLVAVLSRRNLERALTSGNIILYWSAFVIIIVIGNMISRTTIVGMVLALFYLLSRTRFTGAEISLTNLKFWRTILLVTLTLVSLAAYFYNTNSEIKELIRFGFEGFFNWAEKGEWTTSSTERLNSVMWIWPDTNDLQTWLIGKATFSDWHIVGTDIGYSRFIFYNGLIGLITFSTFFIYNAWACANKFPNHRFFFMLLLALSFIIWLKVATDIFIIFALFYCLDRERRELVA